MGTEEMGRICAESGRENDQSILDRIQTFKFKNKNCKVFPHCKRALEVTHTYLFFHIKSTESKCFSTFASTIITEDSQGQDLGRLKCHVYLLNEGGKVSPNQK